MAKKQKSIEIEIQATAKPIKELQKSVGLLVKSVKDASNAINGIVDVKDHSEKVKQINKKTLSFAKKSQEVMQDHIKTNSKLSKSNEKTAQTLEDLGMSFSGVTEHSKDLIDKFRSLLPYGIALHLGLNNIVRSAFSATQETKDWSKELNSLSSSTGSTALAIGQMHEAFYMSGGSLSTVRSIMVSLAGQGIPNTTKGFAHLTSWITNMSLASGIGAESISSFAGVMVRNWKVSIGETERMTSSILAMQSAFNVTASEMDITMKSISDAIEKTGAFFRDGSKSAIAFTKSLAMATGVMSKFGVSTQRATEFLGGLIDPEKIGENLGLLNKLGVSYADYVDMLASGNAKESLFDKLMVNLPQVSQQIQNIADPLARMNFAKSLGLPLEVAQKMAKATTGQIQGLMKDYKKQAEADKAMEKKQKKMAGETARFDEQLHLMKRDALLPMMKWVNSMLPTFWRGAKILFGFFKKYVGGLVKVFDKAKDIFVPFLDVLEGKGTFPDFMGNMTTGILDAVEDAVAWAGNKALEYIPKIISGATSSFINIWKSLWDKHPILTSLGTIAVGMKGLGNVMDFGKSLFGSKGTEMNPLVVRMSKFSGSLLERLTGGKGAKGTTGKIGGGIKGAVGKAGSFLGKAKNFIGLGTTVASTAGGASAVAGAAEVATTAVAGLSASMLAIPAIAGATIGGIFLLKKIGEEKMIEAEKESLKLKLTAQQKKNRREVDQIVSHNKTLTEIQKQKLQSDIDLFKKEHVSRTDALISIENKRRDMESKIAISGYNTSLDNAEIYNQKYNSTMSLGFKTATNVLSDGWDTFVAFLEGRTKKQLEKGISEEGIADQYQTATEKINNGKTTNAKELLRLKKMQSYAVTKSNYRKELMHAQQQKARTGSTESAKIVYDRINATLQNFNNKNDTVNNHQNRIFAEQLSTMLSIAKETVGEPTPEDEALKKAQFGMFRHIKSIDNKTPDKKRTVAERDDWLSSMIGYKGSLKIKTSFS